MKPIKKTNQDAPWNKRNNIKRERINAKSVFNTFLIYCEGANTEREYFESFPIRTTDTKIETDGTGRSRTSLIRYVIDKEKKKKRKVEDTQIWVVFDRDIKFQANEDEDFNNAVELAENNNIHVAYSNDCFELWFLLHRNYYDAQMHRKQIYAILSNWLGFNYEKNGKQKGVGATLYQLFLKEQQNAIKNAQKLHEFHIGKKPCHQNPCTTVYKLVEELNKCLRI